jgi:2-oxoglutarate dehydrogenase E1 component
LVLWEAQFGDFANGAQIVIDTMVSSGETKWNVSNGLVMLLPHGYDGAGPEHSSARVERFLNLTDADDMPPADNVRDGEIIKNHNLVIANCTTAAQYFHLLRAQMRRSFRKPLVVIAPKKLLKFQGAKSEIEDFAPEVRFKRVIEDENPKRWEDSKVRKVIYCTGQVYYDLEQRRKDENHDDVAIVRVEQISPFPFRSLRATA